MHTWDTWGPNFKFNFDLKITRTGTWKSLIHLTTGGNWPSTPGASLPRVMLNTDGGKTGISVGVHMTTHFRADGYGPMEMNKWYNIDIEQKDGKFSLTVDGELQWTLNSGSAVYKNVQWWQSDPWYRSAGEMAEMKNLVVWS